MKFKILIWIFVLIISITGLSLVFTTNLVTQNVKKVDIGWRAFQQDRSEKARLTSSLRTAVGYGGMIHHFKNYVLRQHISQMDKAQEHLGAANNIIKQFRTLGATEQEAIALDDIQQVLNKYSNALLSTNKLVKEQKTPVEIDSLVKVNDTYALRGLEILDKDLELLNRQYGDDYIHTKTKDLTELKGIMGFGGMIHEFKNYVLRQDESRKGIVLDKIIAAKALIKQYKVHEVTLAETIALSDIEITLNAYENALSKVSKFVNEKLKPKAIDQQVKVDDSKAIRGFIVLEREIARKIYADSTELSKQLNFSTELGERVTLAIMLLLGFTIIFTLWVLYSKLIKPLTELNSNMEQLASGNLDLLIKGVEKQNEVGDMARSLLVFKKNAILKAEADHQLKASHEQLIAEVETREVAQNLLEEERNGLEDKIKLRTNDLVLAKESAINANNTKTQFLSRMSHELRTPLNAIFGFSDLLATDELEPLSEQQAESLSEISTASHKLLKLIDDILELSGIELGTLSVEMTEVLLCPIIMQYVTVLEGLVADKQVDVLYSCSCEEDLAILGNEVHLGQILQAVINCVASKAVSNSSINIFLEKEVDGYLKLNIVIPSCVLTELEQKNIFEAFEDNEMLNSGAEGLGMRMSVVKQLVDLMGGKVGISSYPEVGTTLWIELKKYAD